MDFESEAKTFNFDMQDIIDFTKFSKMTMCRASEANTEKYRRSPVSAVFGSPANRTIGKIALIGD